MYDRIIKKLKNHPVTAGLLLVALLIGGLSSTSDSFRNLTLIISPVFQPSINEFAGIWLIEETEYTPKTYIMLEVIGKQIYGKTKVKYSSALIINQHIKFESSLYDTKIKGNIIEFKTKRTYSKIWGEKPKDELIAQYIGEHEEGSIKFVMSTRGGYTEIVTATKLPLEEGKEKMKEEFSDWE